MGGGSVEINTFEDQVDLDGDLGGGGKGAFDALASGTETRRRVARAVCRVAGIEHGGERAMTPRLVRSPCEGGFLGPLSKGGRG